MCGGGIRTGVVPNELTSSADATGSSAAHGTRASPPAKNRSAEEFATVEQGGHPGQELLLWR